MKNFMFIVAIVFFQSNLYADKYEKAYFAGGCFWCMEESFDKIEGVIKTISGYSGGNMENPKYRDVIYKDTGNVEAVEITYDPKLINYQSLLEVFWKNIDPFDAAGQFCDKGESYRSVAFYRNNAQKNYIEKTIKDIESKFKDKEVVTLVWKFKKFMGREYMGIERSTFLIDKNRTLMNIWRKVSVKGHVEEVLNTVKDLT